MVLVNFCFNEFNFSRNSTDSAFPFGSRAQNEKTETTFDAWGNLFSSLVLASFSTWNDFTMDFFAKEGALITFSTYCIYHLLYLPSSMLEEISSSWYFNKKFIVQWIHNRFSGKEMTLVTFFLLKWSFLEIPLILRFLFDSIALNENAEFAEIFRFSINSRDFCQT